tara:strand:+ start:29 stop:274 length:246 start_codon:yes stop_codon:yes gene_type:complete
MEIRYGAGGKPMVVQPVQEIAETKNEKQEVLQEILTENPNEEHTHEDGTTHSHEGGDLPHTHDDVGDYDGFDEDVVGDDGC